MNNLYDNFLSHLQINGKLNSSDLSKARRLQLTAPDETLPVLLIKLGLCSENDVAQALVHSTGLSLVTANDFPPDSPLASDIPLRFLKQHHIAGLTATEQQIEVATADAIADYPVKALELATGKQIRVKIGTLSDIDNTLENQYGQGRSQMDKLVDNLEDNGDYLTDDLEHLKDLASEAPIIKLVNLIFQRAVESQASDIHIEPFEHILKVRLRIDGVLVDIDSPPSSSTAAVLSRIKIMAKLNIAERRLPQDGRIKLQIMGKELDLRVSTTPTLYGESVVIRLLDKENTVLDFDHLGFVGEQAARFQTTLNLPHGILLITGPTGSGKSTTLYTALKQLNTSERKIITVEDPIEYQLEGVNQIQAKPQIGLTFATALRSIVRQDPDVIMIGEMRDLETARIAVQSALTGHLVLSTLHTNDAASGITRLQDMGLEDYLLSSTINGILAQRLVRRLCPHCKQAYQADDKLIADLQLQRFTAAKSITLYSPQGCQACANLGYKGRSAIIEFLPVSEAIRKLIMTHAQSSLIQQQAVKEGMLTMFHDGLSKALQGITTIDEVLRVTSEN